MVPMQKKNCHVAKKGEKLAMVHIVKIAMIHKLHIQCSNILICRGKKIAMVLNERHEE